MKVRRSIGPFAAVGAGFVLALLAFGPATGAADSSHRRGETGSRQASRRLGLNRSMAGVRLGDSVDRLQRVLGDPRRVDYVDNEITGSLRIDIYGKLSFSSYGGSILDMRTARRSIRTPSGIGVGTIRRRLERELPGLSCYGHRCSIVAGGGPQTIGKRVTTFQMRNGRVRVISIGRVID